MAKAKYKVSYVRIATSRRKNDEGVVMSCKPNPHEEPKTETRTQRSKHERRITYTGKSDAKKAAHIRGGNSRPYKVKGGWRITKR